MLVLIGERTQHKSAVPTRSGAAAWHHLYELPTLYWDILTELGAFNDRLSKERLARLGLKFDYKLNLCVPSSSGNLPWRTTEATKAAETLLKAVPDGALLIGAGTRVTRAISRNLIGCKYPLAMGAIVSAQSKQGKTVHLTRIPRLNRNNQQWGNTPFIHEVTDRLHLNIKLSYGHQTISTD